MYAKTLSFLGALVIVGATVLVTAEPAQAQPRGGHLGRQNQSAYSGGYYGSYQPYYGYRGYYPPLNGNYYGFYPYYADFYRPNLGGHYFYFSPYYGIPYYR